MRPPLCRYCGKAIKKFTHTVIFGETRPSYATWISHRAEKPATKEEAQRLLNAQIISLRYGEDYSVAKEERTRFVKQATTWDGESYERKYFCKDACAQEFGISVARDQTIATEAYWKALKKQN